VGGGTLEISKKIKICVYVSACCVIILHKQRTMPEYDVRERDLRVHVEQDGEENVEENVEEDFQEDLQEDVEQHVQEHVQIYVEEDVEQNIVNMGCRKIDFCLVIVVLVLVLFVTIFILKVQQY
jgi:hypothetical protein